MTTKHTPGPWRIAVDSWGRTEIESDNPRDNAEDGIVYVLASSIGGRVHGESFDDFSEVEANVKLIHAAPDLLEALLESRQVIATALKVGAPDWFNTDEKVAEHTTVKKIDAAISKATA
ncbi:hypothetical protein HX878_32535 [Pseudomonas veronii]|uniref:hypothetical protein n=1 Tax=Pseudomonas veronii TaxID=76761 RepID=UPI0015A3A463|nr:hypothetical protein [Pseudomonas veronii]NWD59434.1 hypothetical protein [Pseudomonas veronii]